MNDENDPIVAEVRRIRDEHSAQFNYDLRAIFADLEERQRTSGRTYLSRHPDGTEYWVRYGKVVDGPDVHSENDSPLAIPAR